MSATVDRPAASPAAEADAAAGARRGPRAARRRQRLGLQGGRGARAPRRRADGPARAADVRAARGDRRRARPRRARRRDVRAARPPARGRAGRARSPRSSRRRACWPARRRTRRRARTRCWRCAGRSWSRDPKVTDRLTAPFTALFRPWLMRPAARRLRRRRSGSCSSTRASRRRRRRRSTSPELLLLVFGLAVASAALPRDRARRGVPLRRRPRRAAWAPASTWSGPRSTPTSPTPTACRGARVCATTSAGIYFNAVIAVLTLARLAAPCAPTRCCC